MRILVEQIDPTIGDLAGNTQKIIQGIQKGKELKADLVIFPELSLTGYPPEDFLLLPHFIEQVDQKLHTIVQETEGIAAILGLPRYNPHKVEKNLYNSAVFINNRAIIDYADKMLLPTYDVFDERRYFEPGENPKIWELKGEKFAITVCEDLWQHKGILQTIYRRDPIEEFQKNKPSFLVNISSSPYHVGKFRTRFEVCLSASRDLGCPVILCNQVGGNDSIIFDGNSLHVDPKGLMQHAKGFVEDEMLIDLSEIKKPIHIDIDETEALYQALVLGIRDYFKKLGFTKACLGLSGGIDSAVVATLAVEALGSSNVLALILPSRYSSSESSQDAKKLADNLKIEVKEISIEAPFESYLSLLTPHFEGKKPDITEENLQARIRGMILMAMSNKFGYLVLNTGNKSELALGYSTLYGDMCGGLAVLGDVTKKQVYELAHWINRKKEIIPLNSINRPPTAELRPNQKDSDTLPPYEIIDQVVKSYLEEHRSPQWIADQYHFSLDIVQDIVKKIHANEYKRRQSPPSLRVSEKAFSVGRRFPIVQRWVK